MSKLLLLLSLAALFFVGIGTTVSPNDPAFWLASTATSSQYIRIVLGALLLVQLMTNPPRHLWFRIVAGAVAAVIGFWAIRQTYVYHMQLLDSLAFISASLAIFVTALERRVPSFTTKPLSGNNKAPA